MSAGRVRRALLLAASLAVSACGSPAVSSTPSASVISTATPTDSPAQSPTAAGAELREVAVAELSIGSFEGDPIRVTPGTLHEGDLVWMLRADDADRGSHLVAAADGTQDEATLPFGWVPVAIDGTPTLREPDLGCPPRSTTVQELAALAPLGRLACFGAEQTDFVGFTPIGCGAGGSPRTGMPDWLNGTWSGIGIGSAEAAPPDFAVDASIVARAAPGLAIEQCGSPGWYRVRRAFRRPGRRDVPHRDDDPEWRPGRHGRADPERAPVPSAAGHHRGRRGTAAATVTGSTWGACSRGERRGKRAAGLLSPGRGCAPTPRPAPAG